MRDTKSDGRAWLAWRLDSIQRRVALVAVPVYVFELVLAWTTHGTFDVTNWQSFADSVARVGPIDIYNLPTAPAPGAAGLMVYNHPPLAGWWLVIINFFAHLGLNLGFTMRAATSTAHLITVFLVLAMLRRRVSERWAVWSAVALALSPTMVIISGFHGNNDPSVAMLTILSVYLLVDRKQPLWAGLAFSVGLSVKIVPIIVLPLLIVAAWGIGRRQAVLRLALGGLPIFVLFWIPVLIFAGHGFVHNVLGYDGTGFPRQWGIYQLASSAGLHPFLLKVYAKLGTYGVLALAALLPAWFIRRDPQRAPAALGLCMALFLLLTPGWATQYNSYIAATVFLVEFWSAAIFSVVGGLVYVTLYYQWRGDVRPLTPDQIKILYIAWVSLIPVVVVGLRSFLRRNPQLPTESATDSDQRRGNGAPVQTGQEAA